MKNRSWFHWHLSTFAFMCVPLLFFVLIAIPGQLISFNWTVLGSYEYGWPKIHAVRILEGKQPVVRLDENGPHSALRFRGNSSNKVAFWSEPANWRYYDKKSETVWDVQALRINIGVGAAFCLVPGILFELRRRRRASLLQIKLFDLLILVAIVSAPLAMYSKWISDGKSRLRDFEDLIANEKIVIHTNVHCPPWLERLFDFRGNFASQYKDKPFPIFQTYENVFVPGDLPPESAGMIGAKLANLNCHSIHFEKHGVASATFLAQVDATKVHSLTIREFSDFTDLRNLNRFQNLERLNLGCDDLSETGFDYKLRRLRSLKLDNDVIAPETQSWIDQLPTLENMTR